jgi:uncharacterized protein (UPF0548 family)
MLIWFPKAVDLYKYLRTIGNPPSNFDPEQPIDHTWYVDQHEVGFGKDEDGLFERAVEKLLKYHFYPPSLLDYASDFQVEHRLLRYGDRIVQQIFVIPNFLEVITMNRVTATISEPNRIGFTYTTTEHHFEMGEWTAVVIRKRDNQVYLAMHAISKPGPKMPPWAKPFARAFQIRAHRLGLAHFKLMVQNPNLIY